MNRLGVGCGTREAAAEPQLISVSGCANAAFKPVEYQLDLPALEEAILERWRDDEVFRRTTEGTRADRVFRF